MAKTYTSSGELIEGLRNDMLWLLVVIYAHAKRSAFPRLQSMSREEFVLETVMLESSVRDIVARLTALDDDGKNVRSFHTAFAALKRDGLDRQRSKALGGQVKGYRHLVNALKVEHRNAYIAHVNELAVVKPRILDEPLDFSRVAAAAVNLLDAIVGGAVTYVFKIGSREPEIDLRRALAE